MSDAKVLHDELRQAVPDDANVLHQWVQNICISGDVVRRTLTHDAKHIHL